MTKAEAVVKPNLYVPYLLLFMTEMLAAQKTEANSAFIKFVKKNYLDWIANPESRPLISPDVFKKKIFPVLDAGEKVFFIVLDNFRYDQWRVLSNELADYFSFEEELYFSILPTATQYARNAIFSGLMPNKIAEMFPDLWVDEDEEEGKNLNEAPLIQTHIERYRRKNTFSYNKINDSAGVEKLLSNLNNLKANDLNVVVLNFIDMLSHEAVFYPDGVRYVYINRIFGNSRCFVLFIPLSAYFNYPRNGSFDYSLNTYLPGLYIGRRKWH